MATCKIPSPRLKAQYDRLLEKNGGDVQATVQDLKNMILGKKKVDILQAKRDLLNEQEMSDWMNLPEVKKLQEKRGFNDIEMENIFYRGMMVKDTGGLVRTLDVETMTKAMKQRLVDEVSEVLDEVKAGGLFGRTKNPKMVEDMYSELDGINTGNKKAADGIKKVVDTITKLKKSINEIGGKLDETQPFKKSISRSKLLSKGGDKGVTWIKDELNHLDFEKSFPDKSIGEATKILENRYLRKINPKKGIVRDELEFHYKSHTDQLAMEIKYGEFGDDFSTRISSEIESLTRDLALMKRFGPEPDNWYKNKVKSGKILQGFSKQSTRFGLIPPTIKDLWKHTSGAADKVDPYFKNSAENNTATREYVSAALLGASTPTAVFGDIASALWRGGIQDVGKLRVIYQGMKKMSTEDASRLGAEIASFNELSSSSARYGDFGDTGTRSNRLLTGTLKWNGMAGWTDHFRRGQFLAVSNVFAANSSKGLNKLKKGQQRMLRTAGVTDKDWNIARQYVEEVNGSKYIDLKKLYEVDEDLALKMHGLMIKESEALVVQATNSTKATIRRGTQKGSFPGEALSHLFHLKSTPSELWNNFAGLVQQLSLAEGGAAIGKGVMYSLVAGYMLDQTKRILSGKEPIDITSLDEEQWMDLAPTWFTRGSMMGIISDLGVSTAWSSGSYDDLKSQFIPPVLSEASRLASMLFNADLWQDPGSYFGDLSKFGIKYVPSGSNILLKGLWERYITDTLRKEIDPDFHKDERKKERKLDKETNTEYWWKPGDLTPN